MQSDYILSIENITKSFPGVKALDEVSIMVKRGHVHALVGENGAGKSTLIKILAGIYTVYSGEIRLNGNNVTFDTPNAAIKNGICVVHQELKLSEPLSVAENIFLGNPIRSKSGLVDWKAMNERAQAMVDGLNVSINVTNAVSSLTVAKKQIVEICKSIAQKSDILIMDEPSATLTNKELDTLFTTIKKLKNDGVTVIYISHRLEEIFQISDEISVLRDGRHIGTIETANVDKATLVKMMVGRKVDVDYPRSGIVPGAVILSIRNLCRKRVLYDISFDLRKGEILGVAGLVGAGRTEMIRAILGIDPIDSGEILLNGKRVIHNSFQAAIRNGFGLVPEDRKLHGITQIFPIKANVCMTDVKRIASKGILRVKLENRYAREYVDKLQIITPSIDTEVQYLSGGNQQKVVIAKWLYRNSEILIMDEPTRGIDVGAKRGIYDLICELVRSGKTVIVISSELLEILGVSDRILVLNKGRIVGDMINEGVTQEAIMAMCV